MRLAIRVTTAHDHACNVGDRWCNFPGEMTMLTFRSKRGMSREGFGSLYDECAQGLLAFFAGRVGDPHTARDLWAETFAQAFGSRGRFRGSTAAEAQSWLYGIAYRQLALFHRRGAIEQRALRRLGADLPPLSDEDVERLEDLAGLADFREEVDDALRRLPPSMRDAIALRVIDELPYSAVAQRLNTTPEAARVRVSRALQMLRSAVPTDRRAAP